jgi:hypothetical protein
MEKYSEPRDYTMRCAVARARCRARVVQLIAPTYVWLVSHHAVVRKKARSAALRSRVGRMVVVLHLVASAGAFAQTRTPPTPLGCWSFELTNSPDAFRPLYLTPHIAQLTTDSARSTRGGLVVRRLDLAGRWLDSSKTMRMSHWRRSADGDSIVVVFSLGFAASTYVVALPIAGVRADTVYGRALEYFDYGDATQARGEARGVRRVCGK